MILSRSRRAIAGSCTVGLALTLGACGSTDGPATGDPDGSDTPIVATTSIWADVASEVFCGAEVVAIIPPGADPHSFEPSLQDRAVIEDAALVIANGGGLEGGLDELIDAGPAAVVEVMDHVDAAPSGDHDEGHDEGSHDHEAHEDHHEDHDDETHEDHHVEDHDATHDQEHDETHDELHDDGDHESGDHEHDHGGVDPHVWQDPTLVASALDAIADAGTELGLEDCSDDFASELRALDAEIEALVEPVPANRRVMVTSHDALGHFADRYGFEVVGTVIPANNTLAETNAADLARLAEVIEARSVGAVFTEQLESTVDADALAERLGIDVVPLVTDALTDDPSTDTYIEMMRSNAEAITTALSP